MRTLVLNLNTTSRASYYNDWEMAFVESSYFQPITIKSINKRIDIAYIKDNIINFDLIVLLHACCADTLLYLEGIIPYLLQRKGKLISFVGNEYNMPNNPLSDKIAVLKKIEADLIATQLPLKTSEWLYASVSTAKVIAMPHAVNPSLYTPGDKKFIDRGLDFGVRTFRYPIYLGDNDRNRVVSVACSKAKSKGYNVDVSFTNRLTKEDWTMFLQNSKFTISTPAGTDYISPNDDLVKDIYSFVHDSTKKVMISSNVTILRHLANIMPFTLKKNIRKILKIFNVSFDDDLGIDDEALELSVYNKFFVNRPVSPFSGKCISSRHFDAIGTKTAQVLLEGSYNGILLPYKHYIPINKDLSNWDEVFDCCNNTSFVKNMVDDTYDYIVERHTYKNRMDVLAALL